MLLSGGEGDRVWLKDGKILQGRVVYETETTLVLRQESRDRSISWQDVERVESRLRDLDALLDNVARADLADRAELELLLSQAQESGLEGEARSLCWRLLLIERSAGREHEAARLFLGHEKRGDGWILALGGRSVDWDTRLTMAAEWDTAWESSTLHYRLRSNLPLEIHLELLLDLERVYAAFYGLFGAELLLFDVCAPMKVNLHADSSSYPEQGIERARYDSQVDQVEVDASAGLVFETVAHELTHQILYDTAFRERGRSGEIPGWVNEGLAEYMAAGVARAPQLEFDPGRVQERHFRAHASAKRPLALTRVLALSTSDYLATSDRELKYAQSYTLVHFLLHGAEGAHRPGFLDYLRAVYRGKGSSSDLKRALGVPWRELEKDWNTYVREMPLRASR